MTNKVNYQKALERLILSNQKEDRVPVLLLHSCCAPCSSYVLEYLSQYFIIKLLYYNPNIYPPEEYEKRVQEQTYLINQMTPSNPIEFIAGEYLPDDFYRAVKGDENLPEGGARCFKCYELRLREAARMARDLDCDYFTTTLTISPLKNAAKINEIGERLATEYGVTHLPSDFKKKEGYKRSIQLSEQYGLYRQNYCGCVFSKNNNET